MTHLKVSCKSHLHKKLSQENLCMFYMTHLQDASQQELQVKRSVALWVRLYYEYIFNLKTRTIFVVIFKLKSQFQYCITTMKLRSITSHVSDWPITAQRLRKKKFKNTTRSISESWLNFRKCVCHIWKFSNRKWLLKEKFHVSQS